MISHIDEKLNGTSIMHLVDNPWQYSTTPPVEELMGLSTLLAQTHHPYRVVRNDADLSGLSELVINDARFMAEDEANRIRNFVSNGGTLIATGLTSLLNIDGTPPQDFFLADVLGVSYSGQLSKRVNYLCMKDDTVPPQISKMISSNRPSPLVRATTAKVLAYLVDPLFDPDDRQHWASIHSNPPGQITEYAALTENQYGKGRCIYLAPATFGIPHDAQKCFGKWLLEQYISPAIVTSTNAPPCVEITLLKSTIKNVYLVCFVNYQRELPNIIVRDLVTRIKLPLRNQLVSIRRVSDGVKVEINKESDDITIEVPSLNIIEMFAFEYR
jgi:beta-galactosidase GanA